MFSGVVSHWSGNGWGFIKCEEVGANDIYVNMSQIQGGIHLTEGKKVFFDLDDERDTSKKRQKKAAFVTGDAVDTGGRVHSRENHQSHYQSQRLGGGAPPPRGSWHRDRDFDRRGGPDNSSKYNHPRDRVDRDRRDHHSRDARDTRDTRDNRRGPNLRNVKTEMTSVKRER